MPDARAINALTQRLASTREALRVQLMRDGYDPNTLDQLPEPGSCTCLLAQAIHAFRDATASLTAAEQRTHAWRY